MDHQIDQPSRVLFVSGTGRSGTNITKKIFSSSPQVATLPFEYRFTIDPPGVVDFLNAYPQGWSPFWPDQKINDFIGFLTSLGYQTEEKKAAVEHAVHIDPKGLEVSHPAYAGWELEQWIPGYLTFVAELRKELVSFEYEAVWPGTEGGQINNKMLLGKHKSRLELLPILGRFLEKITRSILSYTGKAVFLEDNTYNILFAKDLFDLYPNSQMLHVIRDPRDVLSSVMEQRWTPSSLDQMIVWYKEIMKRWDTQREQIEHNRYREVRFEDIVSNPEKKLQEIASFFRINLTDDMMQTDLSQAHIGRYKETFSQPELKLIEKELATYLNRYNY